MIADFEIRDAGSHFLDDAGAFMTEHHGHGTLPRAPR